MSEHWTDRLSEYLDGELPVREREACEAHLARCGECAAVVEELRAVVAQASLLPDHPPGRDLWPEIEDRLHPRDAAMSTTTAGDGPASDGSVVPIGSRRRVVLTVPQLVAASITLIALSAGAVRLMLPVAAPDEAQTVATTPSDDPSATTGAAAPVVLASAYNDAIRELEVEFERRQSELDPETIRVVATNLAIIDAAIADANQALAEDPSSAFLSTHLANAMRQKMDLLKRVAAIERTES